MLPTKALEVDLAHLVMADADVRGGEGERSRMRSCRFGLRPLILVTTLLSFLGLVTRILLPEGGVLWAAVILEAL